MPNVHLGEVIAQRRQRIITEWESAMRSAPAARHLSGPALRDHLPRILERLAELVGGVSTREGKPLSILAARHALDRLDVGFDLHTAVTELALLRDVILELWAREVPAEVGVGDARQLTRAFDELLAHSVDRYARQRERTLRALDDISTAALGSPDLATFLPRLLEVMVENNEAVDTTAILLLEDGELRVRASVGLDPRALERFSLRVGEGFAGRIIQTREPLFVRHAAADPLVRNPALRARNVQALYGVPLLFDDQAIGVAHMGSLSAFEFSEDDQQLFRAMIQRATSLIVQAQLHERERRAVQQLEQERARLAAVLARLEATAAENARLLEQEQRRSEFAQQLVGIVSHDLRNPLSAILFSCSALLRHADAGAQTLRTAARIRSSAERAVRMIRDLLDFTVARVGGGLPVTRARLDLHLLAQQAVEEVRTGFPERQVYLEAHGPGEGEWDGDRLAQVLSNLVTNALKYSPAGTPVTVRTSGEGDEVRLEVHNGGAPIAPRVLKSLFEPLRRGTSTIDPSTRSIGLGLYIVQQVVHAHAGTVHVTSTTEAGTTFEVRLPRRARA